jgi:uncharacterized SAM-binding protein YcdF (DUF218 family)
VIGALARLLEAPLVVKEPFAALDAIVVLGAPLGPADSLTDVLAERVRAAAALYHAGGAPRVIATGGITRGAGRAEADVLADALRAAGIPDVIVEREALTTADNARFVAALLPRGARVWLVTQPFHGRRAARLFRAADLDARVWHIDGSLEYADRRRAVRWLLREYAAWAKLLVR